MTSRIFSFVTLFAISSTLIACSEDPLVKVHPLIVVDPMMIDFGEGFVDMDNVVLLKVMNKGSANLEISEYAFEHANEPVFSVREPAMVVVPSDMEEVEVVFVPRAAHAMYASTLIIRSNDPLTPELRVPLQGTGGVREIDVEPPAIDFGIVNEGTAPRRGVTITNLGKDPLIISRIVFTSTSVDMLLAPNTFSRGSLLPLTSTIVEVVYSPVDLGADSGTLEIESNDEDEPRVLVPVIGNANLAPVAIAWVCDKPVAPGSFGCQGVEKSRSITAAFRRFVGLDGLDTVDPEGGSIMAYRWSLVRRPTGSTASPFHSTEDRTLRKNATGDIQVDQVGAFEYRLIATDERGLDSLDRPESHVFILPRDLEVLLRWDLSTDVDLHVVRPGGSVGDYGTGTVVTSTGSDCSAFNRRPNWNDLARRNDDPSLDKDDVTGRGPEIISLDSPEDGGTYSVFVHYCDSRRVTLPVGVEVEVYVRGEMIAAVPANDMTYQLASGEVWEAARVHVTVAQDGEPSATVEDLTQTSLPVLNPGLCLSD